MGGLHITVQPFSVYQAIEWIVGNSSFSEKINGIIRIRRMVDMNQTDDVIKLGIVSRLVELLDKTDYIQLQSEIIWTLANVAAGTSSHAQLILHKALPSLLKLLEGDTTEEFKIDIVWTLANLAGDSAECRDKLLDAGIHLKTMKFLESSTNLNFEKNCIWLLTNIFRHKRPVKDFNIVATCIPTLLKYLHSHDCDIVINTCWSFKYIADGMPEERNQLVKEAGVCSRLVELIGHHCKPVVLAALLVCINITAGSFEHAEALLCCDLIPALSLLLAKTNDQTILKNVCYAFSNIAAGNLIQIQKLIDGNVFLQLFQMFPSMQKQSQIEVLHAINNAMCCGSKHQLKNLFELGLIQLLYRGLLFDEDEAMKQSLEGLLFYQEQQGLVVDPEVIPRITQLRTHFVLEIRFLAQAIIQNISDY